MAGRSRASATDSAFELAFSDARNGFAAVRDFGGNFNGYVLRTSDGGKTWQPQLIDDEGIDNDGLVATGSKTAIVLSLGNALFATTTGGQAGKLSSSLKTKKPQAAQEGDDQGDRQARAPPKAASRWSSRCAERSSTSGAIRS